MSRSTNQPSPTLYVNNLEGKVKKIELRKQLYALFQSYGKIIDIISKKGLSDRGQAFIVFSETAAATSAMRALVGEEFYGRGLRIDYAKSPSHATLKAADPSLNDPSSSLNQSKSKRKNKEAMITASRAEKEYEELERQRADEEEGRGKRERDGEEEEGVRKKRRLDGEEEEDEEMDVEMDEEEDEEEGPGPVANGQANGSAANGSGGSRGNVQTILLASNLPQEANEEVMSALFQQYPGYQTLSLLPAGSTPTRSASIVFSSEPQAHTAQKALDGFLLKTGCAMGVVVVPADAL